jgi:hypothetical protein
MVRLCSVMAFRRALSSIESQHGWKLISNYDIWSLRQTPSPLPCLLPLVFVQNPTLKRSGSPFLIPDLEPSLRAQLSDISSTSASVSSQSATCIAASVVPPLPKSSSNSEGALTPSQYPLPLRPLAYRTCDFHSYSKSTFPNLPAGIPNREYALGNSPCSMRRLLYTGSHLRCFYCGTNLA